MARPLFEVCLEGVDAVQAAREGGADRVELCAGLVEGGTTPSHATIAAAVRLGIPVMVMIRPRGGDFDYSDAELAVMEADIVYCREVGAHGIVFGCLQPNGEVAQAQGQRMVRAAGDMAVTFHRAFDVCRDPYRAMRELSELGVTRILTSGQAATAPEGKELIARLVAEAPSGLTILPGGGITPENVQNLLDTTGAREFHATAFARQESRMRHRNDRVYMGVPGLSEYTRAVTSAAAVREFISVLR